MNRFEMISIIVIIIASIITTIQEGLNRILAVVDIPRLLGTNTVDVVPPVVRMVMTIHRWTTKQATIMVV